jgi:hypothetical protein
MGSNPQWRKEYKTVICVGNCTRRIAKEGGYIFIPGCPPTLREFYENLPLTSRGDERQLKLDGTGEENEPTN